MKKLARIITEVMQQNIQHQGIADPNIEEIIEEYIYNSEDLIDKILTQYCNEHSLIFENVGTAVPGEDFGDFCCQECNRMHGGFRGKSGQIINSSDVLQRGQRILLLKDVK